MNIAGVRHAAVVAPHSDDETIAAFFLITALRRQGARVDIIVATDGSASHRNSTTYPKARLVALREVETIVAMHRAGVPRQDIAFLGLPDGGLRDVTDRQTNSAVRILQRRPRPDLLVVPSPFDDHPDHRVVAKLCDDAWPTAIPRLRYVVWPAQNQDTRGRGRAVSVEGDPMRKRAALLGYRSQLGLIQDDPDGFALSTGMIARMCRPREHFTL